MGQDFILILSDGFIIVCVMAVLLTGTALVVVVSLVSVRWDHLI